MVLRVMQEGSSCPCVFSPASPDIPPFVYWILFSLLQGGAEGQDSFMATVSIGQI